MLAELSRMPPTTRSSASAQARDLLQQRPIWQAADAILFFAPVGGELDIWPLLGIALAAGKTVALPRFDLTSKKYMACQLQDLATEVTFGRFGIREPLPGCGTLPLKRLDLVLVPGVAFDLHGRRLGRGRGFYDQILAEVRGTTCGVAYDEQIVGEVPVEPHDVFLNCLLTPSRWVEL